jgi:hypothetical protein
VPLDECYLDADCIDWEGERPSGDVAVHDGVLRRSGVEGVRSPLSTVPERVD